MQIYSKENIWFSSLCLYGFPERFFFFLEEEKEGVRFFLPADFYLHIKDIKRSSIIVFITR
jgi:hypothetical protein